MQNSSKDIFLKFIEASFPKRSRSAVIRHRLAQRIIDHLKGIKDSGAAYRHFLKKSRFDMPSADHAGGNKTFAKVCWLQLD